MKNVKVRFISLVDIATGIGNIITSFITFVVYLVKLIKSPFSLEEKDGKMVFSIAFKKPIKAQKEKKIDFRFLLDVVKIKQEMNGDYVLVIKMPKIGYLCLHPFPTSDSGAYAYLSPNARLITASWYIGPDEKEKTASLWIKKNFGHGYRLTSIELGKISNMRVRLDGIFAKETLLLTQTA